MTSDSDQVFDLITRRLPAAGLDCLMIGGHAVNHYGVIRATQDIDFMIAANDAETLQRIMREAGYTNFAIHETVMFFNRPGSPLRVDFLTVERETMRRLLENAVAIDYAGARGVRVPRLRDLLAMKIFALATGGPRRQDKDFTDVVGLVMENQVDVDRDLLALCREFGTDALFSRLRSRIEELRHA